MIALVLAVVLVGWLGIDAVMHGKPVSSFLPKQILVALVFWAYMAMGSSGR